MSSPQPVELVSDADHSARSRKLSDEEDIKYNQAIRRADRESNERMKESSTADQDTGK